MLVNDCMTRHPILISPEIPASEAQKIMTENNIRHLPVTGDGKRLEGLITRQSFAMSPDVLASLDVWDITRYLSGLYVKNIMLAADKIYTITPQKTVERAARIMNEHKIGCLPVLEDGEVVVGIITETDLLDALQEMLGMPEKGVRVTMRMPDRPGEFAKLSDALGEHRMGVIGIGTYPSRRREGYWDVVLKIRKVSCPEVDAALSNIPDQEIIDLRDVV
jgi:acetoin utilization protein AcuB